MSSWRREQTGKEVASNLTAHSGLVNDLQLSVDQGMIITASKDMHSKVRDCLHVVTSIRLLPISPKLLDADTLDVVKTYVTDRPVNSACIAPDRVTPNRPVVDHSLILTGLCDRRRWSGGHVRHDNCDQSRKVRGTIFPHGSENEP